MTFGAEYKTNHATWSDSDSILWHLGILVTVAHRETIVFHGSTVYH